MEIKDAAWGDAGHTFINAQITFEDIGGPYPYTARPDDAEPRGRDVWAQLTGGVYHIDEFSPPELDVLKARKVTAVKAEAERRILAIMPEYKQRNTLAQFAAAVQQYDTDPADWPVDLQRANDKAMSAWSLIEAIRAYSNELEALINSKRQHNTLADIDITTGWPE